ncbi:MAG: hypothetical protein HY314_01615 [Acidobacteria bacterium]|nr:hypothetical protein [Acidobacteriota bacterium]
MRGKRLTAGSVMVGFIVGFSASHFGLLKPGMVRAAIQHFYFNSVRIGLSLPPLSDFFATGDLIVSRRTFTTDLIAGTLKDPDGTTTSGRVRVRDEQGRDLVEVMAPENQGGSIAVRGPDGNTTVQISGGPSGGSIQLNGRSLDLAETFEVREKDVLEPGHVVVIDPEKPGRLRISARAYDSGVAGMIAGADGLQSGVVLGPQSDDAHKPVALSGRVYTWADAAYGKIKPGDLLTTSPTPGHAMRVSDLARAQGSIIGKAMEDLDQGKGRILVLVNLQ